MPIVSRKIREIFKEKGSALLTALLVMGVLMSISLALSALVLRETYTTREVLDAGKAYYGAESGIEVSLYKIKHSLPGWETPKEGFVPLKVDEEKTVTNEYKVDNTCSAYPCFGADFNTGSVGNDLTAFYDVLGLDESITIPLFVVGEDGKEHKVKDFTVEFYGIFDPNTDLNIKSKFKLSGWDILRWKILGISDGKKTESISDFTALSTWAVGQGTERNPTDAAKPSWFGSISCSEDSKREQRYANGITCVRYGDGAEKVQIGNDVAKTVVGNCTNTQAREHYVYDANGEISSIEDCYEISNFLQKHTLNYLTLTNLMNPAVFNDGVKDKIAMSKIYFRVELFGENGEALSRDSVYDNKTVREYAEIVSNGYSGDSKQSISVNLKRDSFMPVFNFSLYSTYKNEKEKTDWNVNP